LFDKVKAGGTLNFGRSSKK